MSLAPDYTFINRLTSAEKMGVRTANGVTILTPTQLNQQDPAHPYSSPYTLTFRHTWEELTTGWAAAPYNQWQSEGNATAFPDAQRWYDRDAYQGSPAGSSLDYGPERRTYGPPPVPAGTPQAQTLWKAERLIALAAAMVGYGYRHHHLPDWNPNAAWYEGQSVASDPADFVGQGLDCSNFTAWLYDYALGLNFTGDTGAQGCLHLDLPQGQLHDSAGNTYTIRSVADARQDFDQLCATLQTGDMLFIAGEPNLTKAQIQNMLTSGPAQQFRSKISHVVTWLGDIGASNPTRVVIDSHDFNLKDSAGNLIPKGIQVRQFVSDPAVKPTDTSAITQLSWYYDHFVWALRILPDLAG